MEYSEMRATLLGWSEDKMQMRDLACQMTNGKWQTGGSVYLTDHTSTRNLP